MKEIAAFDECYASEFAASAAAGLESFKPDTRRLHGDGIDFSKPAGTSQFTAATFCGRPSSSGQEHVPFELPCSVHWDSCCGTAFLSPSVADWLLEHHPECITVVNDEVKCATVTVVNASSTVIIEKVVDIHGMHLSGVPLPDLRNIRVVRGFKAGFLIGNPFHEQLGGSMDLSLIHI